MQCEDAQQLRLSSWTSVGSQDGKGCSGRSSPSSHSPSFCRLKQHLYFTVLVLLLLKIGDSF